MGPDVHGAAAGGGDWPTYRGTTARSGSCAAVVPARATIALAGCKIAAVNVLDHDGCRTGKTLPVDGGRFAIDGARDKTLYYEVVFE